LLRRRLPALLLLVISTAALSASTGIVQAIEECRLEPGVAAPSGSKWLFRVNRDHRRCWFLSSSGGHRGQPRRSASVRNRHLAGDADAARQGQLRQSDAQITSAPTSKPDVAMAAKPAAAPQVVTPSVEQFSENLIPRSVPTIAYRVLSHSTVSEPTAVAARTVQPPPTSTSHSNLVLLAGAAAGLIFAGGVFQFTRRGPMRARKRTVANRRNVRGPVVVRSSVAASPPRMTIDWPEDLRRKLRELTSDRAVAPTAANLPPHIKGMRYPFRMQQLG
jgi:hypothetical protein